MSFYESEWKGKYFKLLSEQENAEKKTHDNEELLCKTVIRLTLAVKGLNKKLDPYLIGIHKAVKAGLNSAQLKVELEKLTRAALNLSESMPGESGALLFDYLIKQSAGEETVRTLKSLQQKYENGGFKSSEELFLALLDAMDSGRSQDEEAMPESGVASDKIKTDIVSHQLLLLLDDIDIPLEFEKAVRQLKARLQNQPSPASFKILLNDVVSLLVNVKNHIQTEQKDIQQFLSDLTEQLNELGLKAGVANEVSQQIGINRNELDRFVSAQMQELRSGSANATSLEPVKQLIGTRLNSISKAIQQHRENEDIARRKTEQQLSELTDKIKLLDAESRDLKLKLALAHDKALRDPLTGLGNRMAYDERLEVEMARWQRYQTPLTLFVWDIDNFKNINDTLGHKAGDKTLTIIARLLRDNCREVDFLSRFGGEEFTMLLPNTDQKSALALANKLRLIIENTRFNSGRTSFAITMSCGISQFRDGDTPESVFERADKALYKAKESGRNRCIIG